MAVGKALVRSLIAGSFIYEGLEAVVNSERHARLAQSHFSNFERLGVPPLQLQDLKTLSKASGFITAYFAWRLLRGKTPRLAVLVLSSVNLVSAAIHARQTKPGEENKLDLSRISTAIRGQAALLSLLKRPIK